MNPVATAVSGVTLGIDTTVRNLTMFPLLSGAPEPPSSPLTLDEALSSGWTHVTEVSEAGSVPELRVVNKGASPVLILDGEELVGAKQNRIVNLSILVPPQSSLNIPVSCVEAGRWHARSRSFAAAPRAQYAAGRAQRMRQVTVAMAASGARHADQTAVWEDIAAKSARLHAHSPTSAMEAMFVGHRDAIEEFVEGLAPVPGQVGALFAIGDRVIGFDVLCAPALLRKLLPKLVRSYALDAVDALASAPAPRRPRPRRTDSNGSLRVAATQLLAAVIRANGKSMPAVGLGEDVRIEEPGLTAAALVADDRLVHLSAFAM